MKLSPVRVFSCKHPQRSQQHLDPSDNYFLKGANKNLTVWIAVIFKGVQMKNGTFLFIHCPCLGHCLSLDDLAMVP